MTSFIMIFLISFCKKRQREKDTKLKYDTKVWYEDDMKSLPPESLHSFTLETTSFCMHYKLL